LCPQKKKKSLFLIAGEQKANVASKYVGGEMKSIKDGNELNFALLFEGARKLSFLLKLIKGIIFLG